MSGNASLVAIPFPSGFQMRTTLSRPRGDQPAIVGELHAESRRRNAAWIFLTSLPLCMSQSMTVAVFAGRGEDIGIAAEADVGDAGLVTGQAVEFVAGLGFPDPESARAVAAGQQHAIGAEAHGGDPVGVLLDGLDELAVGGGIELEGFARAAQARRWIDRARGRRRGPRRTRRRSW